MILNELLQWAAIAFLAIVGFGLTRQLGRFLATPQEQLTAEYGPDLGARLPEGLVSRERQGELRGEMKRRGSSWSAIVVLSAKCEACDGWVESLTEQGSPEGVPVAALLRGEGGPLDGPRVAAATDLVLEEVPTEELDRWDLRGTPFLMAVDHEMRVRYKQLGGRIEDAASRWRHELKEASDPGQPLDAARA